MNRENTVHRPCSILHHSTIWTGKTQYIGPGVLFSITQQRTNRENTVCKPWGILHQSTTKTGEMMYVGLAVILMTWYLVRHLANHIQHQMRQTGHEHGKHSVYALPTTYSTKWDKLVMNMENTVYMPCRPYTAPHKTNRSWTWKTQRGCLVVIWAVLANTQLPSLSRTHTHQQHQHTHTTCTLSLCCILKLSPFVFLEPVTQNHNWYIWPIADSVPGTQQHQLVKYQKLPDNANPETTYLACLLQFGIASLQLRDAVLWNSVLDLAGLLMQLADEVFVGTNVCLQSLREGKQGRINPP